MSDAQETLELSCGEALQLQFAQDELDRRYYVKIIGWLPGGSIIVTAPMADGKLVVVREGRVLTARAFAGNQAVAFSCSVLRVCLHPYAYLHLSYPDQFRRVTVRKAYRVPVQLAATVTVIRPGSEHRAVEVRLVDLSAGGAMIESTEAIAEAGERVGLSARLPVERMDALPIAVFGRIRNVATADGDESGAVHRYGLEFDALDASSQLAVRVFVYEQMFRLGAS
ncbi:flagellar brake protein [Solimonas marina]|uniref:Flagellar brake protein n=1 Tax=Solimonas marina TaxID=2714601 RepID=A0A969W932_9GAMM|nr:flagellar brake protein [Solimonas marina]NKF21790.1 flagellar brake protein [Solimonas marina]